MQNTTRFPSELNHGMSVATHPVGRVNFIGVIMKEIALTQGKVAMVDDEDFEELNKFKWQSFSHAK
jgi:hypothetical protein